jgi:hypothetical protein
MGAWGEKAFENDGAMDWLAELEPLGVAAIHRALSTAAETSGDDYLDVDDGTAAIAAAEIVAAARGKGRDRVPKRLFAWLDANAAAIGSDVLALARRAVERVLGANSELRALWDEGGVDNAWRGEVRELLVRLEGDPAAADNVPVEAREGPADLARLKQGLVMFLHVRGLVPNARQMARIEASVDPVEVQGWLARVVDAPSVDAVLNGPKRTGKP